MNALEDFKAFVKTLPGLKEAVKQKEYTWQQLYEFYVMYGKDDAMWDQYKEEAVQPSFDFSKLALLIKSIDLNALTQSLEGIQKILSVASTFLVKEDPRDQKENYRGYHS